MSFSVDQFMQVKCKFQLTSETDSSESIHSDSERIRLSSHVDLDKNSTLIALICSNETSNNHILTYYIERRSQPALATRPKTIIKQVYYHDYNEDIVAICFSESGSKLALVNASSTCYILPIKNILLNLHAKQLRSSQGKSMYFYDARLVTCAGFDSPTAVALWESLDTPSKTTLVLANEQGEIRFVDVEEKREVHATKIGEPVRSMRIMRDRFSVTLLVTSDDFRQFRYTLELLNSRADEITTIPMSPNRLGQGYADNYADQEVAQPWDKKPVPIRLHSGAGHHVSGVGAIQRVFVPSSRVSSRTSLLNNLTVRERPIHLIFYLGADLVSVVDVLGPQRASSNRESASDTRLLRFYPSRQYYYKPQKPALVCKLNCLAHDEMITHLVLTDRFIAIATDQHRCLICSRNCCNLRHSNSAIDLDPLVKEIAFNNEERILSLLKSPVYHDQDNIIDSFLLVTTRSIYSIEARQSCRDMFVNLIDSHLGIKSTSRLRESRSSSLLLAGSLPGEFALSEDYMSQRRSSESNLMIANFLCHRDDIYERINYDSRAFSVLFKVQLNSLYEAYGDKLLLRGLFELANRFYQLAGFDHVKILGKYIRLGAYRKSIEYIVNILSDDNEVLDEKERIELAKAGFDCLLAKAIVERSKMILYNLHLPRTKLKAIQNTLGSKLTNAPTNHQQSRPDESLRRLSDPRLLQCEPYQLCEHSPRCQDAKLSANTVTMESGIHEEDDEATMTDNPVRFRTSQVEQRLECEKSLIEFVKIYLPSCLFPYAMNQLVDFDMIDLADSMAMSDSRIHDLIRVLSRTRDGDRVIFRDQKYEHIINKLNSSSQANLIKIDSTKPKFLEFITSPQVTKALVKDISLASEYLGYKGPTIQFRMYSFAALKHLETYREFVKRKRRALGNTTNEANKSEWSFDQQQKQVVEDIFLEFLCACLDESTEDACRLWCNYVNFYLNYVGTREELEKDILRMLESRPDDCRVAITLYKAIAKDEEQSETHQQESGKLGKLWNPVDNMKTLHRLTGLFNNRFLVELLDKSLDLVSRSTNLDALSDCLGVDGLMGPVQLPMENTWRHILKTIQTAALSPRQRQETSKIQ